MQAVSRKCAEVCLKIEAKVISINESGIVAQRLDIPGNVEITVAGSELFLGNGITRVFPAIATRGREAIRVDDIIQVVQTDDGEWSRRKALQQSLQSLERGKVVYGHIVHFEDDWVILAIEGGIPARAAREPLDRFLAEHGEISETSSRSVAEDRLRVGDPISGYLVSLDDNSLPEVDIASHLEHVSDGQIEGERVKLKTLKDTASHHAAPEYVYRPDPTIVPCPKGFTRIMVVDDDRPEYMKVSASLARKSPSTGEVAPF